MLLVFMLVFLLFLDQQLWFWTFGPPHHMIFCRFRCLSCS